MKPLLIFACSFLALQTQAEVKASGTVLASSCARNVRAAQKFSVCYASVTGLAGAYLLIGDDIWAFSNQTTLGHLGTVVNGRIQYRMTTDMRTAQIKRLSGDTVEIVSRGVKIIASDFETIFHTL